MPHRVDPHSSRRSRSEVYDEPPLRPDTGGPSRGGGRSRHWLHDDEPPSVEFSDERRRIERRPGAGPSDFEDRTSAGPTHPGYDDRGRQEYPSLHRRRSLGESHEDEDDRFDPFARRRGHGDRADPGARDFRDYGRGDYRGNVTPAGRGYAEANYGPTRYGGREYGWSGRESGNPREGSFRGRGPKNYQRSDERIREVLCERLTEDPDIDASDVEIQVSNGEVRLTGTVDSLHTKYRIEEIAYDCAGVRDVDNALRVRREAR